MNQRVKELVSLGRETLFKVSDTPGLDSEILLAEALGILRFDLLVAKNNIVDAETVAKFYRFIEKRKEGVPVAYIFNKKDFFEDTFFVDERVLVPRPESEFVVTEAICHLKNYRKSPDVLDLCCGSGCVGLSILRVMNCNLTLSDISADALDVARKNASDLYQDKEKIRFIESDLFNRIKGRFDVITVNPPYLSRNDMCKYVYGPLKHEPEIALFGGESGVEITEKIIKQAPDFLNPEGVLIVELGYEGADKITSNSLVLQKIVNDYNGFKRVAVFNLRK